MSNIAYWKKVEILNFQRHARDFYEYFHLNPGKFNRLNTFWNAFKPEFYGDYFSSHQEFDTELKKYGTVKEITMLIILRNRSNLHSDHTTGLNSGVNVRLNIPILNCENSVTCFYEMPEEHVNDYTLTDGGTKVWNIELIKTVDPVTCFQLTSPTLLRTSAPHVVLCLNKAPRIAMSISFYEDPVLDN